MLTDPHQDITSSQAQNWTMMAISQLWGLASKAWEEQDHALHKATNAAIAQSEMDVKIQEYYHNQHNISTKVVHLPVYSTPPGFALGPLGHQTKVFGKSSLPI